MKLTVKNKLLLGFGSVLAVVFLISVNTYYRIVQTTDIQNRVINLRQPTVMAGMNLADGLHLSLAGLRGYMILGGDPKKAEIFKNERAQGWKHIDASMAEFNEFAKNWTVPANIERLQEMQGLVEEFRTAQEEVEAISHTDENVPAFKTLLTEAAPRASTIMKAITALIDEESKLPATGERKKLLKLLADSRGSFAIGLANIRAYLLSGDTKFRDNFLAKWEVNETRFKQIEAIRSLFTPTQDKAWNDYSRIRAEFAPYPGIMFKSRGGKEWNKANHWLGSKAAPKAKKIMEILQEMRVSQDELAAKDIASLEHQTTVLNIMMVVGTLIAILIGAGVSVYISRMITVPLNVVVTRAKAIAEGDLSGAALNATGDDELTELTYAINDMDASLKNVMQMIGGTTSELAAASDQLNSMSEKTSQGMENQRRETEQVATAMNEMTATVQEVAQNASIASTSAKDADNEATAGTNVVEQNMASINNLAQSIEQTKDTIYQLGEDTKGVDDIVKVISGIAEQTNLLALNAAIEAARAGEQGRGFAVVADEVRSLAASSQKSTEEIRTMLERLKTGATDAVQAMDEGHAQAQSSVEQARAASVSLTAISTAIAAINDMNAQIATASEEQSAVAEEMNRSIVEISGEAETTLENTRETSVAAAQVGSLAVQMKELVARFKMA